MKLLVNDASVLLNLLAADCIAEIASALGWQFAICPLVRDEAKQLRDASTGDMTPVDIAPLIEMGVLQILEISGEDEQAIYVEQSIAVDDGEAMSIAIAASRNLELAIDDKQASNHARRTFPGLKLWTTPEIIKLWADAEALSPRRLRRVLSLIEARARYRPSNMHPLAAWWKGSSRSESDA
jgi:predicted nucleic acid-binding protein